VSSSWRFIHSIPGLQKILEFHGFKGEIIDFTPIRVKFTGPNKLRGYEIQAWIDLNPIENMVILDDDSDMAHLIGHLVKTNKKTGLTEEDARKAISIVKPNPILV
jgi:hypothetical protein